MSPDPHPASEDVGFLSATEVVSALASGEITSVGLVTTLIDRVGAIDADASGVELRSIAAVAADAVDIAQRADTARASGTDGQPLLGVPVVIKDNIEAVGLPGTAGSTSLAGRPTRDAPLVARLRDAGAVVFAASNLSEWANIRSAHSTSGWSATGGLVGNPWALDRNAGGSSSGSGAAVAAGLTPLAVGTETDGSIVCPASVNGVVGLKPTVGTVPTRHIVPISASQDSPGPMARTVDDVALLFGVLAKQEPPPRASTVTFAQAGTWRTGHAPTDTRFDEVVAALRAGGHRVHDRAPASPEAEQHGDELTVLLAELVDDLSAYLAERPGEGVRSLADVVAFEKDHADVELPFFGHDLFEQAVASGGRRGDAYGAARARNLEWATTTLVEALEGADVLLAPAFGPAWKSDLATGGAPGPASCVTTAPAIAGWPIVSLPVGLIGGLPVGLGLIARPHDEWRLLDAARIVENIVGSSVPARPSWTTPRRG